MYVIPLAFLCCLAHCYTLLKPILYQNMPTNTLFNMYAEISRVLRAKIPNKDVLKQQILTDSIAKHYCLCRGKHNV